MIADNLKQFRRRAYALYRPFDTKRLHKLRIAGKRLRCAIDLFAPYLGEALKPFSAGMKQMQTHLGSLHEHDTRIAGMSNHTSNQETSPSAARLLSIFIRHRTRAYLAALGLLWKWETDGFPLELAAALNK